MQKLSARWFHPLFSFVMSLCMAFIMTGFVTFLNTGTGTGFVGRWMHAFVIAWPVVVPIVYFLAPRVRKLVARYAEMPK